VNPKRRGPDPQLVARVQQAQAGDEQAFTELFEQLHPAVLNYAYQVLGDGPSAEDVTQDAFVVAHQRLGMLGPPFDFKSWVFRIAGNLAIDQIRKDRRLVDLEDADVMGEPPTTRRPPEKQVRRAEQQRQIRRTLDRLPPAYRQALVLREIHELSYDELARALECSYDSARQVVHRARLRFREAHGLQLRIAGASQRCSELGDMVSAYQDGELTGEAEAQVREHLAACPHCRGTQEDLRAVAAMLVLLPPLLPSPHWTQQVLQQLQQGADAGQGAAKVRAKMVEQPRPHAAEPLPPEGQIPAGGGSSSGAQGGGMGSGGEGDLAGASLHAASGGRWLAGLLFGAAAMVGLAGVLFLGWRATYGLASSPPVNTMPVALGSPANPGEPTRFVTATPVVGVSSTAPTHTPTPTATPSPTGTEEAPTGTAAQNANCRTGPGTVYRNVATLLKDQMTPLDGRNAESTWWWIPMPGGSGHCWVWGDSLSITGPAASRPVIAAPPTDTPIPGDAQPPVASISVAPTGPGRPTDHDKLSLSASAADASGIAKIEVWLQLSTQQQPVLMRTCTQTTTCIFSGGPYPAGMAQAFARAWDTSGNQGESSAISFVIYALLQ